MAHDAPTAPPRITPATATTKRGIATASFSLGLWGLAVFWWYPFGMMIATVAVTLGVLTLAFGVRAGKDGENLAALGIFFGSVAINFAIGSYRFMQLAFEDMIPAPHWTAEFGTALTCMGLVVGVVGMLSGAYLYQTRPSKNTSH